MISSVLSKQPMHRHFRRTVTTRTPNSQRQPYSSHKDQLYTCLTSSPKPSYKKPSTPFKGPYIHRSKSNYLDLQNTQNNAPYADYTLYFLGHDFGLVGGPGTWQLTRLASLAGFGSRGFRACQRVGRGGRRACTGIVRS